jgi:hypothetical protein
VGLAAHEGPPKSLQCFLSLAVWTTFYEVAAEFLFLLPAGRPRFFAVDSETADFADRIVPTGPNYSINSGGAEAALNEVQPRPHLCAGILPDP